MFNFFKEIKESVSLPKNLKFDNFNIINISGKMLYVEGHRGLIVLSEDIISFKVKNSVIEVFGNDLLLLELTEDTLKICGTIKKVEQI